MSFELFGIPDKDTLNNRTVMLSDVTTYSGDIAQFDTVTIRPSGSIYSLRSFGTSTSPRDIIINETGLYAIELQYRSTAAGEQFNVAKNQASALLASSNNDNSLIQATTPVANHTNTASTTTYLYAGDKIRLHVPGGVADSTHLKITQIVKANS